MNYFSKKIFLSMILLFGISLEAQGTTQFLKSASLDNQTFLGKIIPVSNSDSDDDSNSQMSVSNSGSDNDSNSESDSDSSDNYTTGPDPTHYSQSDHYSGQKSKDPKVRAGSREDHNDDTIAEFEDELSSEIKAFKRTPGVGNLQSLLESIASLANKAYNADRRGKDIGIYKHSLCKEFMNKIKADHAGSEFDNVKAEYSVGDSQFDVIWYNASTKQAYVFDYKFGDEKNSTTPSRATKYKSDVARNSYQGNNYTLTGGVRDINATSLQ